MDKRLFTVQEAKEFLRRLNGVNASDRAEARREISKILLSDVEPESRFVGRLTEKEDLKDWICQQPTLEGKSGALRMLAQLGHANRRVWKAILDIGTDKNQPADLRGYALYALRYVGLQVTKSNWASTGQRLVEALSDEQAKVRETTAYILGEMASPSKEPLPTRSELVDQDAHQKAEAALVERWWCEADTYVCKMLVIALGKAGGCSPRVAGDKKKSVIGVLENAVDHPYWDVWAEVPKAVAGVAANITRQERGSQEERSAMLKDLLEVLEESLKKPDIGYEEYRVAIVSVGDLVDDVVRAAGSQDLPRACREVAGKGVDLLLDVAELVDYCFPEGLRDSVRVRAVKRLGQLDPEMPNLKRFLNDVAVPRLQCMLTRHSEEVSLQVTRTLTSLMGAKEAADFFATLVLEEGPAKDAARHYCDLVKTVPFEEAYDPILKDYLQNKISDVDFLEDLQKRAKARAVRALNEIPQKSREGAFNRLVTAVQQPESPDYQKAHEALSIMGSAEAADALIGAAKRKWVEDRFFKPIDKADEHGRTILDGTVMMSKVSWGFTMAVALAVTGLGAWLLYRCIQMVTAGDVSDWQATAAGVAGVITTIAGLLTPFFWNSANAVQKANAEMTRLVTAFHGYIGRMRLLGLGFADRYTKGDADIRFLTAVSDAAADAMSDSTEILTKVGYWPADRETVEVPELTGMLWDDAVSAAKGRALHVTLKELAYSDVIDERMVVSQSRAAKSQVGIGTTIELTLSKGKKP